MQRRMFIHGICLHDLMTLRAVFTTTHRSLNCFDLRTGTRRTENHFPSRGRSDSNYSIWFIALKTEQRAFVTDEVSHEISFGCGLVWRKASVMLRPRRCRSCFRDKCSQLISACLPKLAARVGLAPTPCGLTNRRATLTPPGNGAAGRILTCIVPLRRRMPDIFDHGSKLKLVSAAGIAPAIPRSQAECVGCYATR